MRMPVIVASVVTAIVALLIGALVVHRVSNTQNRIKTEREDRAVAAVLAEEAAKTDNFAELRGATSLLLTQENQRATVVIGHQAQSFGAMLRPSAAEVTVRESFDGGRVTVMSTLDSSPTLVFEFVAFGSALLAVVLGAAVIVNMTVTREVRRRASEAVIAADRVAAGDFTARIGEGGPGILSHFAKAFDAMAGRLEQAERDQRRFLADLAHEIATPLNAVAGFAVAVIDGKIPAERARGLIAAQTTRVSELLDDLSQLRSLDSSQDRETEDIDLGRLCTEAVEGFGPAAEMSDISLRVRPKPLVVNGNPRLLDTVVRNLVSNAIRYTPAGGDVEVGVRSDGNGRAVVYVKDNGIGIAPEHQARVFDRFYRVDEARDRETGGTGLGLAIAKRAAESMGGLLDVHSAPGQGSEFKLLLPLRGRSSADVPIPAGPDEGSDRD